MKYLSFIVLALFSLHGYAASTGRIFVTNESGNTITVINSETNKVETTIDIGKRPRGIGLSPDASELYVAVSDEDVIRSWIRNHSRSCVNSRPVRIRRLLPYIPMGTFIFPTRMMPRPRFMTRKPAN